MPRNEDAGNRLIPNICTSGPCCKLDLGPNFPTESVLLQFACNFSVFSRACNKETVLRIKYKSNFKRSYGTLKIVDREPLHSYRF